MLRDAQRLHALYIVRSGTALAQRVELAADSESRRRGLLGREGLDEGAALIIAPCNAVHTFFMRFAIDIVFAALDGRILKTRTAVVPWRIAFSVGAFATVELPAGAIARADARPGDVLQLGSGLPSASGT